MMKNVITTLLYFRRLEFLVGVLDTTLQWMKTTDPKFEEGAITYYCETESMMFPCQVIKPKVKIRDNPRIYEVVTNTGLFIDIPAFELWTGWEEDFPSWFHIDWGNVVDWTEEQIVEELADDEEFFDKVSDFEKQWESKIDVDYYEKLAQEYELAD
jgi:hypothetical protein